MADRALQAQQDSIRIPVYGIEGFRTDWPTYDQTLINCFAEVVRNPISGDGDIVATKRAGFQNITTLDFASLMTDGDAFPIANYVVSNVYDVYICAFNDPTGGVVRIITYRPQAGTVTQIATIASTSVLDRVYFSHGWVDTSDNPTWVVTTTWEDGTGASTKGFVVELSGGTISAATWSQITHANSPWGQTPAKLTRGPLLQLNNQWYVASSNGLIHSTGTQDPNGSYVSNADTVADPPGAGAGWANAANFIESRFPETYVGLIQYKHHLVALGLTSIQFFTDEGENINPGTPILPTDQALIRFGCISGKHCINVDDILYWVAYGKDNTVGMWKLDGYTPVKVSNKKQDDQIRAMSQNNQYLRQGNMFSMIVGNKKHIGISNLRAYTLGYILANAAEFLSTDTYPINVTDCAANIGMYSIEDKTWWYFSDSGGSIQRIFPATSFGTPIGPTPNMQPYKQYFLAYSGNDANTRLQLSYITEGAYLDDFQGSDRAVCMAINFNGIQVSTEKRKRINKVKVVFGTNLANFAADTSTNGLYLCYSRKNIVDDTSDVKARRIEIPNSFYRYYWNNLGMSRNLSLCIVSKINSQMSIRFIEIDMAQGTS